MTVIHEFYAFAFESPRTTVRERKVRYDAGTINAFFKIQNAPHDPNLVVMLNDTVDLDEVTQVLCDKVVPCTMVRGAWTAFPTRELRSNMKIWHHFICAQLMPIVH